MTAASPERHRSGDRPRETSATPAPTFSIITPTYNGAATVARTIASVLAQTEASFEHLLVDDCSSDRTAAIVADFCARDARVRALRMPENAGGPARPKALGIASARGEFVAFCDQDDYFEPNKLARFLTLFRQQPNADVIFSDYRVFDERGELRAEPYLKGRSFTTACAPYLNAIGQGVYEARRLFAAMLGGLPTGLATIATVIRRSALLAQPYTFSGEFRIADDLDLWVRLVHDCSVLYLDEPLSNYLWSAHTVSRSEKNSRYYADETVAVWRRAYRAYSGELSGPEDKRARRYGAALMFDSAKYSETRREQRRLCIAALRTAWNPWAAKLLVSSFLP